METDRRAPQPNNAARHKTSGFTLIELLVVISIIVVLASLALPAIMKARETARSTQCISNLRQLYLGMQSYVDINKKHPPYRWEDPNVVNQFGVVRPRWQWIISDFLGRPAQDPDLITTALAEPVPTPLAPTYRWTSRCSSTRQCPTTKASATAPMVTTSSIWAIAATWSMAT